jgi:hypothetical protein
MRPTPEIQRRGYSIEIFLPEGTPTGLKLIEKTNWSGLGVMCPRPRFTASKQRDAFRKPGVYVLTGPSDTADLPKAYIGEGDPVRERLEEAHKNRDFWNMAYFFTSKDARLNKAHVEHLEHRLVALAADAKRCTLENGNVPNAPSLSESESAFADTFLDEALLCFPILGVNIFERPMLDSKIRQLLILTNKGVQAKGYESDDGFIVKKGSTAVVDTVRSAHAFSISLRQELQKSGILKQQSPQFLEFTEDYEFSSPSTAAAVLVGASINGRDFWKTQEGVTLKELQAKAEDI